eukprot:TRINITY_DN31747_c0_g1_i1.p1 TRINITY_DN31747_c0_g1~~TRINITY_DN31747_c0_g1_i1.p1  ORF type:complete len:238 (+),score=34.52 TRINITY_DN31747_c0_g1_i1:127-840(+)
MIRRPPRSTHCISSAASDVYKRQVHGTYIWVNIYIAYLQVNSQYQENNKGFIIIKTVLIAVPFLMLAAICVLPFTKYTNMTFNHYVGCIGAFIQILYIFGNLAFMITRINKFYFISAQFMLKLKILMYTLIVGCIYRLIFNIIATSSQKVLISMKNYEDHQEATVTKCHDQGPSWGIITFLLYFFGDAVPTYILILLFNPKTAKEQEFQKESQIEDESLSNSYPNQDKASMNSSLLN